MPLTHAFLLPTSGRLTYLFPELPSSLVSLSILFAFDVLGHGKAS